MKKLMLAIGITALIGTQVTSAKAAGWPIAAGVAGGVVVGTVIGETIAAHPVYCAPAPVYCAPPVVVYGPRVPVVTYGWGYGRPGYYHGYYGHYRR